MNTLATLSDLCPKLNHGPPEYKAGTLTTRPLVRQFYLVQKLLHAVCFAAQTRAYMGGPTRADTCRLPCALSSFASCFGGRTHLVAGSAVVATRPKDVDRDLAGCSRVRSFQ